MVDTLTDYLPDVVAEHLGRARIDGLAFLAFGNEVGGLWLTNSFKRLGRASRRKSGVAAYLCSGQPSTSEVRAVLLAYLGAGRRRDFGLHVLSGCRIRQVPDPDQDSATSERVTSPALIACPRSKSTRSRHARRHRT